MNSSSPFPPFKFGSTARIVIAAAILIRLAFVFVTPAWQSADERGYYAVAKNLAAENRFPKTDPNGIFNEAYQPPLFFVASACLLKLLPQGMPYSDEIKRPDLPLVGVRLLNLLFSVITIVLSWRIFCSLPILTNVQRLSALGVIAFLPTHIGISSSVNNDALVICLSAISIYYSLTSVPSTKTFFLAGFWGGIALLAKLTAISLIPVLLLAIAQQREAHAHLRSKCTFALAGGWATGLILLFTFNLVQHGTPIAIMPGVERVFQISWGSLGRAILMLNWSFWLTFGRVNQIHPHALIYIFSALPMTLLSIYGCWRGFRVAAPLIAMVCITTGFGVVCSLWFTLTTPDKLATSWGKNLFPVLPLIAAGMSYGWHSIGGRAGNRVAFASIAILLIGCTWGGWKLVTM